VNFSLGVVETFAVIAAFLLPPVSLLAIPAFTVFLLVKLFRRKLLSRP
jgi:hypothetical protein